MAFALLFYLLRRHFHKQLPNGQNATSDIYFPPDPIYNPATKVLPKAELDSSQILLELDGSGKPCELDSSESVKSSPSKHISIKTTAHELPGSDVSSLAPSSLRYPAATGKTAVSELQGSDVSFLAASSMRCPPASPMPTGLHALGQQHYGSAENYIFALEGVHRSYRPLSGILPAIQSGSEISLISRSASVLGGEQGGGNAKESEKVQDVQKDECTRGAQGAEQTSATHGSEVGLEVGKAVEETQRSEDTTRDENLLKDKAAPGAEQVFEEIQESEPTDERLDRREDHENHEANENKQAPTDQEMQQGEDAPLLSQDGKTL